MNKYNYAFSVNYSSIYSSICNVYMVYMVYMVYIYSLVLWGAGYLFTISGYTDTIIDLGRICKPIYILIDVKWLKKVLSGNKSLPLNI